MAKIYKSSVFVGETRGWGDSPNVRTRMQLVAVHPPLDPEIAYYGANKAGVMTQDLGKIEVRYSDSVADPHLGSLVLLTEVCKDDESVVAFEATRDARLKEAVTNIATLASMGTASRPPDAMHNEHFDAGMPIIFPGSTILAPTEIQSGEPV